MSRIHSGHYNFRGMKLIHICLITVTRLKLVHGWQELITHRRHSYKWPVGGHRYHNFLNSHYKRVVNKKWGTCCSSSLTKPVFTENEVKGFFFYFSVSVDHIIVDNNIWEKEGSAVLSEIYWSHLWSCCINTIDTLYYIIGLLIFCWSISIVLKGNKYCMGAFKYDLYWETFYLLPWLQKAVWSSL